MGIPYRMIHHRLYSSHAENRPVETVFTYIQIYMMIPRYSDCRLSVHAAFTVDHGFNMFKTLYILTC